MMKYILDTATKNHLSHLSSLYFNQPEIMAQIKAIKNFDFPNDYGQVDIEIGDKLKASFKQCKELDKYLKKVVL